MGHSNGHRKAEIHDDGTTVTITANHDYSFDEALVYLGRSVNECMHAVDGRHVCKALHLHGRPFVVEVSHPAPRVISVRCTHGQLDDRTRLAMVDYIVDWLDLNRHLEPFYALAAGDEVLGGLVTRFRGLHVIGIPDLFEALCWAIIGQQINLAFAYTLKRRFVEQFGGSVHSNGRSYALFPTPEDVASLHVDNLLPLQFSRRKAEYVIEVAQRMASGDLSKQTIEVLPSLEEQVRALVGIRGIGSWTAHYVLMRCLHRANAFPASDVGLHQAIQRVLRLNAKPSLEEVRTLFEPWEGWEAYATFYLWRSLYDQD